MALFKKKPKEEPKPMEQTKVEDLNVAKDQTTKEEMTLEEVVSLKTESWYKAQVIELLFSIDASLKTILEKQEKE